MMRLQAAQRTEGRGGIPKRLGRWLASYLNRPLARYRPFSVHDCSTLAQSLQPGDVLLVEGELRVSAVIKYLTQSTWSHAALYVGDALPAPRGSCGGMLIEADIEEGVIAVPVAKYTEHNTRICRPVGLSDAERGQILRFMIDSLGMRYDLQNVFDLIRYLVPLRIPPRYRRRLIALGSGDPTRAICSTLIAQAFQQVRYPILPHFGHYADTVAGRQAHAEALRIRHHSLFAPRDFDLSPFFEVVKPTLASGFDYRALHWIDDATPASEAVTGTATAQVLASSAARSRR